MSSENKTPITEDEARPLSESISPSDKIADKTTDITPPAEENAAQPALVTDSEERGAGEAENGAPDKENKELTAVQPPKKKRRQKRTLKKTPKPTKKQLNLLKNSGLEILSN